MSRSRISWKTCSTTTTITTTAAADRYETSMYVHTSEKAFQYTSNIFNISNIVQFTFGANPIQVQLLNLHLQRQRCSRPESFIEKWYIFALKNALGYSRS
jgi:hypothetical protein